MLRAGFRESEANAKPSSDAAKVPRARARRKNWPAKAGVLAARRRRPPPPFHVSWKLTIAFVVPAGNGRWSTTATSRASTVTTLPLALVVTASSGRRTVQTSPAGVMRPVKSWMREPGPGSKRSIHTNPNVP